jgi:Domain of unknown function (DUF4389)
MADHPVRIVVEDDLQRSRLTVLVRLLLAIPHLIILAIFAIAAFFVAIAGWLVAVVTGRLPDGIHSLLSQFVRYATRVDAYLGIAANPWPPVSGSRGVTTYTVDLELPEAAEGQRRLTILFRFFLALPALVLATVLGSWVLNLSAGGGGGSEASDYGESTAAYAGGLATAATVFAWFVALALARVSRGLRDLIAYAIGFGAQTWSYLLLLTDRYPDARPDSHVAPLPLDPHPVRLGFGDDLRRSRLTVFFRLLLALPHIVWLTLWGLLVAILAIPIWLATLVAGRNPVVFQRFVGAFVRYDAHVSAFILLVGGPFPGFDGRAGVYPVDVTVDRSDGQHRLKTLVRLVLAVPAFILAGGYAGASFVTAFFGWFASLILGRMPAGLAHLGAASIRYNAQTLSYFLLLTDRYPFASPALAVEEPEPEPEPEPELPGPEAPLQPDQSHEPPPAPGPTFPEPAH